MRRIAFAVLALSGCGYVGDPLPPALNIPVAVADLQAVQVGDRVEVSFSLPVRTTEGLLLEEIGEVELIVTGADASQAPVRIPVEAGEPRRVETGFPAAAWIGQTVRVMVRSASTRKRWSEWATVPVAVANPLAAPASLSAVPGDGGIRLSWTGPADSKTRIWKAGEGQRALLPVATVEGGEWLDREAVLGAEYRYAVESVSASGAASTRTAEIAVKMEDRVAPPAPTGLNGVTGIGAIELAWDASPATDVAGYKLFRAAPGAADFALVSGPTPAASYSDRDVQSGARYRYAVSAVDTAGNESARSEPVEVAAP